MTKCRVTALIRSIEDDRICFNPLIVVDEHDSVRLVKDKALALYRGRTGEEAQEPQVVCLSTLNAGVQATIEDEQDAVGDILGREAQLTIYVESAIDLISSTIPSVVLSDRQLATPISSNAPSIDIKTAGTSPVRLPDARALRSSKKIAKREKKREIKRQRFSTNRSTSRQEQNSRVVDLRNQANQAGASADVKQYRRRGQKTRLVETTHAPLPLASAAAPQDRKQFGQSQSADSITTSKLKSDDDLQDGFSFELKRRTSDRLSQEPLPKKAKTSTKSLPSDLSHKPNLPPPGVQQPVREVSLPSAIDAEKHPRAKSVEIPEPTAETERYEDLLTVPDSEVDHAMVDSQPSRPDSPQIQSLGGETPVESATSPEKTQPYIHVCRSPARPVADSSAHVTTTTSSPAARGDHTLLTESNLRVQAAESAEPAFVPNTQEAISVHSSSVHNSDLFPDVQDLLAGKNSANLTTLRSDPKSEADAPNTSSTAVAAPHKVDNEVALTLPAETDADAKLERASIKSEDLDLLDYLSEEPSSAGLSDDSSEEDGSDDMSASERGSVPPQPSGNPAATTDDASSTSSMKSGLSGAHSRSSSVKSDHVEESGDEARQRDSNKLPEPSPESSRRPEVKRRNSNRLPEPSPEPSQRPKLETMPSDPTEPSRSQMTAPGSARRPYATRPGLSSGYKSLSQLHLRSVQGEDDLSGTREDSFTQVPTNVPLPDVADSGSDSSSDSSDDSDSGDQSLPANKRAKTAKTNGSKKRHSQGARALLSLA